VGGPIALVRDGDLIAIDAVAGRLDLEVSEEELARRRTSWIAPASPYQSGVLRKYADQVGPARKGAVTHAGGRAEVVCYADI
jgi:dihydroxy-acid dehydratase